MIKHIIKNVIANKVVAIIFILQVILSIVTVSEISYQKNILDLTQNNIEKVNIDVNKTYTFNYLGFFYYNKHKLFLDNLNSFFGEDSIGISIGPTMRAINSIPNESNYYSKIIEINKDNYMGDYYKNINTLVVSESVLNKMNIKITDGENLTIKDFNSKSLKSIPILASSKFDEILSLGDKITTIDGREYIIKGFFDTDINWIGKNGVDGELQDFTSMFIEPFVFIEQNQDIEVLFNGLMLFNESNLDIKQVKDKVEKIAFENGMDIVIKSMKEELDIIESEGENQIKTIYLMASVIVILMLFGISTVVIYSIKENIKKIGIYKTIGFSDKNIKLIILSQWIIYIVFGIIVSLGCIWFKNNSVNEAVTYDMQVLIYNLAKYSYTDALIISGGLTILVLLIVLCASKKIDKLQISNLIGGRF